MPELLRIYSKQSLEELKKFLVIFTFEIHTIELRKGLKEKQPLSDWIRFFNATSEEELNMINTKDPGLLEAIREVKVMSLSRRFRLRYEARLKEKRDRMAREEYVRQEGKEEGMALGENRKLMELIQKKLARGQSVEEIAEALEETPEHIEELLEELK